MPKAVDLLGVRFGRWLVTASAGTGPRGKLWECLCDCGGRKTLKGAALRDGKSKSCGCLAAELLKEQKKTHGMADSPTYNTWIGMISRCKYPTHLAYPRYGGRGITVCDSWKSFDAFYADMGVKPEGKTLDRIDNNGNYTKENCRWATAAEQMSNRRCTVSYTASGRTMTQAEWARKLCITEATLIYRVRQWGEEIACSTPRMSRGPRIGLAVPNETDSVTESLTQVINQP